DLLGIEPRDAQRRNHSMEEAGQKLKRARERLNLRYRDVEEASNQIAARHNNDEFVIALSRLSDIENKGTVPTIYRLYSLCTIYRLDINRSEEHTSELQSLRHLVCRLLLEKKNDTDHSDRPQKERN